jgi:hypothetical protein
MKNAADQTLPLVKQTPHRVVRELYEQFIAYGRAYTTSISDYKPANDGLASANVNAGSAVVGICNSIVYGSASRSIGSQAVPPPSKLAVIGDPMQPVPFIADSHPTCSRFQELFDTFNAQTAAWQALDSSIPASQWTPEQRSTQKSATQPIEDWANEMEAAGRGSGNPVLEDFSVAAAIYLRTYASIGDSYTAADAWLSFVSLRLNNLVLGACRAAAG